VKLVDINVIVYALDDSSPHHARAKAWLADTLSGVETVALPWVVLLAVIRLVTNPRVFATPFTPEEACDIVAGMLERPCVTVVHPTDRHHLVLRELLLSAGTAGNLTMDAHLAALALEHGAVLCSADGDFRRFSGLRTENPLTVA